MDCVACEKCRLWGKLQVSGLGTALKILFSYGDRTKDYQLSRTEVISLLNAFGRLSNSITQKEAFEEMLLQRAQASYQITTLYDRAMKEWKKLQDSAVYKYAIDQENRKVVALSVLVAFLSTAFLLSRATVKPAPKKATKKE